jgi:hypothetical protein
MRSVAAMLLVSLAGQIGCNQESAEGPAAGDNKKQGTADNSPGNAPETSEAKVARRDRLIRQMLQAQKTAKKAVPTVPPEEVRRNLVGVWRVDAQLEDGKWKSLRKWAGNSKDIEFRADGTLQIYLMTFRSDGVYQTSPGDGCVDVLMTLGKSDPYTYSFSIAFEQDKLFMTSHERTDVGPERYIKSIENARRKGKGLTRYYRVPGFLSDE